MNTQNVAAHLLYKIMGGVIPQPAKEQGMPVEAQPSQTTALANERNDIDLMRRRLEANVLLIKAVGGGWDVSILPNL
jgi:hypothetical protein